MDDKTRQKLRKVLETAGHMGTPDLEALNAVRAARRLAGGSFEVLLDGNLNELNNLKQQLVNAQSETANAQAKAAKARNELHTVKKRLKDAEKRIEDLHHGSIANANAARISKAKARAEDLLRIIDSLPESAIQLDGRGSRGSSLKCPTAGTFQPLGVANGPDHK